MPSVEAIQIIKATGVQLIIDTAHAEEDGANLTGIVENKLVHLEIFLGIKNVEVRGYIIVEDGGEDCSVSLALVGGLLAGFEGTVELVTIAAVVDIARRADKSRT